MLHHKKLQTFFSSKKYYTPALFFLCKQTKNRCWNIEHTIKCSLCWQVVDSEKRVGQLLAIVPLIFTDRLTPRYQRHYFGNVAKNTSPKTTGIFFSQSDFFKKKTSAYLHYEHLCSFKLALKLAWYLSQLLLCRVTW